MKRKMFLGLCMATFIAPVAMAQYPQLTEEAKQAYQKMMSEERRRSDEAWAKALSVVQKEAREGRPYISWLPVHTICRRHEFLLSPVLKEEVCTVSAVVAVR